MQQAEANLAQLDRWIAIEERRAAELRRGEERRPLPPEGLIERGIGAGSPPVSVHQGECVMAEGVRVKAISEDQAERALYAHVEACPHCNPDTALRVIPEYAGERMAARGHRLITWTLLGDRAGRARHRAADRAGVGRDQVPKSGTCCTVRSSRSRRKRTG
ncbi:DUF6233 domain-containing protein [Streptomyces achromogenes]|uniref:DUF6233 domain-containing protein n=1 Tax=Streptomyces achromogenes TaxID=67255 RepID=UPI0027D8D19A|nr:DUF6233 domain-containing protein [Streptomyces achromogenes]